MILKMLYLYLYDYTYANRCEDGDFSDKLVRCSLVLLGNPEPLWLAGDQDVDGIDKTKIYTVMGKDYYLVLHPDPAV